CPLVFPGPLPPFLSPPAGCASPGGSLHCPPAVWVQFDQVDERDGWRAQFGPPGFECNLLYLACLTALVFAGSGPLGIDDYLTRKSERPVPRVTREALEGW